MLVGLIVIFVSIPTREELCGDGICLASEVSFCNLDCKSTCLNNSDVVATAGFETTCSRGWADAYFDVLIEKEINLDYLKETEQIDFSHPTVQSLATQLKKETAKETAKAIAKWTFDNIRYDTSNDFNSCKGVKASEVIERGFGICSTQSKVNTALLRANGIPARMVTGCLTFSEACRRIQTFFRRRVPTAFPVDIDDTGHAPTRGGLHNYVEILLPEEENWVVMESTVGLLYDSTCINYESYFVTEKDITPDDDEICGLLRSNPLVEQCRQSR